MYQFREVSCVHGRERTLEKKKKTLFRFVLLFVTALCAVLETASASNCAATMWHGLAKMLFDCSLGIRCYVPAKISFDYI